MKLKTMLAVGSLVAAALIPLGVTSASASYEGEVCTPSEAWTETIQHPAVGEPTIVVDNPDYKPAVEEVSHTEYGYTKWTWVGGGQPGDGGDGSWHPIPGKLVWDTVERSTEPWVEGQEHSSSWFKWDLYKTKVVIDVEGQEAVGEPTIEVENPDYVEAWTETIEHPEVTCPVTEEPFTADICHAYGTADATIVTVTSKDELKEHLDHGDAPVSAEACENSKPVVEEPTFPICHVTVAGDTEGESIRVERDEIKGHLDHGDYPGTCVDTPVDPEPEPTPTPTPVVPEPTDTPDPVKATATGAKATDDSTLAVTGGDVNPWLVGSGLLALLAGAGTMLVRRKH